MMMTIHNYVCNITPWLILIQLDIGSVSLICEFFHLKLGASRCFNVERASSTGPAVMEDGGETGFLFSG